MKVGGRQNNTTTTIQDVHILGFTRDITDVIKVKELECEKATLDYPSSCKFLKVEEGDETEEAGEIQNMKGMQSIVAALKMEGGGHDPRNAVAHWRLGTPLGWNCQGNISILKPSNEQENILP